MGGRAEPGTDGGGRGGVRRDEGRAGGGGGEAVREQVITPRPGRVGTKGRGAVSVQRPNTRKSRPSAQTKGSAQGGFTAASVAKLVLAFVIARFAFIALSL